jgi:5-methylthioadenosine/S-adenosylhomocysteine deaminase
MKLAVGRDAPFGMIRRRDVALGLGTDGASSNNGLDLFQDVKVLALLHKFLTDDPSTLPAAEALAIARGQRSRLLGGTALAVGAPADFLLARVEVPELVPGELDADLVYAATGAVVDTTVVAGEVLMVGREVGGAEEVLAEVRARAARVRAG